MSAIDDFKDRLKRHEDELRMLQDNPQDAIEERFNELDSYMKRLDRNDNPVGQYSKNRTMYQQTRDFLMEIRNSPEEWVSHRISVLESEISQMEKKLEELTNAN